jgi:hypothetical protein
MFNVNTHVEHHAKLAASVHNGGAANASIIEDGTDNLNAAIDKLEAEETLLKTQKCRMTSTEPRCQRIVLDVYAAIDAVVDIKASLGLAVGHENMHPAR